MLQRCGILKPNNSVSLSDASSVMVFLHVRKGTRRLLSLSNAIYPCIIALKPIEPTVSISTPCFSLTSFARLAYFTTLAGYIHWQLTGEKVLGVGEASGMFPVDSATRQFNAEMTAKFNNIIADKGFAWKLEDIIPGVLTAGEKAGVLYMLLTI